MLESDLDQRAHKKFKRPTVEDLRQLQGCEKLNEEEVNEVLDSMEKLCVIVYNYVIQNSDSR